MADDRPETANDEKLEAAFEQLESAADQAPSAEKAPAADKAPAAERQSAADPKPQKSGGGSVLAVLLSLIAIAIAAYPAWQLYQQSNAAPTANPLTTEVGELRTQASEQYEMINSRIAGLNDRLDQLAIVREGETGEQSALKRYVEQELANVRARLGASAQDFVTAEVEYLIRMANQSVLMERDANAARQMLEAADAIIQQTQGFTAHGLRKALAEDIAALRAVATPDTQGIYLELSALIGQVQQLKQKLPEYEPKALPPATAATSPGWAEKLMSVASKSAARLASLVDFRRDTVSIAPILPPSEAYYLRQNLVLKIQLAQLALLEGNEIAYRATLNEAADWIDSAFGDEAAAVALRAALIRLADTRIQLDMPDISGSLAEVRRHVASVQSGAALPEPSVNEADEARQANEVAEENGDAEVLPE